MVFVITTMLSSIYKIVIEQARFALVSFQTHRVTLSGVGQWQNGNDFQQLCEMLKSVFLFLLKDGCFLFIFNQRMIQQRQMRILVLRPPQFPDHWRRPLALLPKLEVPS